MYFQNPNCHKSGSARPPTLSLSSIINEFTSFVALTITQLLDICIKEIFNVLSDVYSKYVKEVVLSDWMTELYIT